jgi:hypothetical protein
VLAAHSKFVTRYRSESNPPPGLKKAIRELRGKGGKQERHSKKELRSAFTRVDRMYENQGKADNLITFLVNEAALLEDGGYFYLDHFRAMSLLSACEHGKELKLRTPKEIKAKLVELKQDYSGRGNAKPVEEERMTETAKPIDETVVSSPVNGFLMPRKAFFLINEHQYFEKMCEAIEAGREAPDAGTLEPAVADAIRSLAHAVKTGGANVQTGIIRERPVMKLAPAYFQILDEILSPDFHLFTAPEFRVWLETKEQPLGVNAKTVYQKFGWSSPGDRNKGYGACFTDEDGVTRAVVRGFGLWEFIEDETIKVLRRYRTASVADIPVESGVTAAVVATVASLQDIPDAEFDDLFARVKAERLRRDQLLVDATTREREELQKKLEEITARQEQAKKKLEASQK